MRLGIVRGHVVLHTAVPELLGTRLVIVEPVTAANLAAGNGQGGGKALVLADHLDPGPGQMVGFVEGREAANPYWPGKAPVDAYCALLVDAADFEPPREREEEDGDEERTQPPNASTVSDAWGDPRCRAGRA